MGVLDKLLSAVKLNDDMDEDDFFSEDLMDDFDDEDLFEEKEEKSRSSFFKFNKKNEDLADDFDDEFEEIKKPEKKKKEKEKEEPAFTFRTSAPKAPAPKPEKAEKAEKPSRASSKITPMRSNRRSSTYSGTPTEVCVLQPKSMEDTHEIADALLDNSMVILNLEGIDVELAQRISDFSFGVCYSLQGNLQKVSTYIFVLVPNGVDITGVESVLHSAAPTLSVGY